jgi:hypothetical protein
MIDSFGFAYTRVATGVMSLPQTNTRETKWGHTDLVLLCGALRINDPISFPASETSAFPLQIAPD